MSGPHTPGRAIVDRMADLASSTARQVLPAAAAATTAVVQTLPADATDPLWSRPTPCTGWDVRRLLSHLVAEHLWAPRLLAGESMADVGDAYDGDVLGVDPPAAWQEAITASLLAWAEVDDEDVEIQMSYGPATRQEYARQMLVDLVVHGWDLARATGQSYEPAEPAVQAVLDYEGPRLSSGDGWPGVFAKAVPVPPGSELLDRAVALTGRDPGWSAKEHD